MQSWKQSELSWIAFGYVAEELSPEEADAFEERLAVDQQARDAVVRAVQLSEAVVVLADEPVPVVSKHQHNSRRALWAVVAVATVCLVLLIRGNFSVAPEGGGGWLGELSDLADRGNQTTADQGSAGRLVALWTDSDALLQNPVAAFAGDLTDADDPESVTTAETIDEEFSREFSVPSWMLAAVSTPVAGNPTTGHKVGPEEN